MPRKYTSRGPKCPVCQAVMHPPADDPDGAPVCSFVSSHEAILRMRAARATSVGEINKASGKLKGRRNRQPRNATGNRFAPKKKKGKNGD